jgi:hypothetical protein
MEELRLEREQAAMRVRIENGGRLDEERAEVSDGLKMRVIPSRKWRAES